MARGVPSTWSRLIANRKDRAARSRSSRCTRTRYLVHVFTTGPRLAIMYTMAAGIAPRYTTGPRLDTYR